MDKKNIQFNLITPPGTLCDRVLHSIHTKEEQVMRRNSIISLLMALVSGALCFCAGLWLRSDLDHSVFIQSFSLLFTDHAVVMQYWQDFTSTLLEALPFVSLASCLVAFSAVIVSIYALISYRTKYNTLYQHHRVKTL